VDGRPREVRVVEEALEFGTVDVSAHGGPKKGTGVIFGFPLMAVQLLSL